MKYILLITFMSFYGQIKSQINLENQSFFEVGTSIILEVDEPVDDGQYYFDIQLLDSEANAIASSSVIWDEQRKVGLKIPSSIPSGNYILRTNLIGKNLSKQLLNTVVVIVNMETFNLSEIEKVSKFDFESIPIENQLYSHDNPLEITGRVIGINGTPLTRALVYLQFRGASEGFHYTLTDDSGKFSMNLTLFGEVEYNFSTYDMKDATIEVLKTPYSQPNLNLEEITPFPLSSEDIDVTILKNYVAVSKSQVNKVESEDIQSKLEGYDEVISIEDFISLSSTEEIYKELIPLAKVKNNERKQFIKLLNKANNMYYREEPLYLIDGIRIKTARELFDLNPRDIKAIYLAYNPLSTILFRQYGRFARFGIINIRTKAYDYQPEGINLSKWQGFDN